MEDQFDEFLNDTNPVVTLMGQEFLPSVILKNCDPIAYRVALSDWESFNEDEDVDAYED